MNFGNRIGSLVTNLCRTSKLVTTGEMFWQTYSKYEDELTTVPIEEMYEAVRNLEVRLQKNVPKSLFEWLLLHPGGNVSCVGVELLSVKVENPMESLYESVFGLSHSDILIDLGLIPIGYIDTGSFIGMDPITEILYFLDHQVSPDESYDNLIASGICFAKLLEDLISSMENSTEEWNEKGW